MYEGNGASSEHSAFSTQHSAFSLQPSACRPSYDSRAEKELQAQGFSLRAVRLADVSRL